MAQRTVAFFGSTSGCVCACIALTLQAGHRVVALARSPSKLTSQLQDRGIAKDVLDMKLETVQGNVKDIEAVTKVLQGYNGGVDTIINGIGKPIMEHHRNRTSPRAFEVQRKPANN